MTFLVVPYLYEKVVSCNHHSHRHVSTLVPFIQMTERTTTHEYPREEIRAMMDFYDGKTCVLTHNRLTVHWAHMPSMQPC
jgi:hypothetical protein